MKNVFRATVLCALCAHGCDAPTNETEETAQSAIGASMNATVFGTGGIGLRVRTGPGTTHGQVGTVWDGQTVKVLCQTRGEYVVGTDVWDKIESPSGYVTDAYVRTGRDGFHPNIERCDGSSGDESSGGGSNSGSSGGGSSTSSRGFNSIWGGGPAPITSEFDVYNGVDMYSYARDYGLSGNTHTGIDVGIGEGTKLYTPVGGKVVCVGGAGSSPDGSSCGYYGDVGGGPGRIQISMDDGNQLIFGHCRSSVVSVGQRVEAGAQVGTSGSLNGAHVHVEVRVKGGATPSGWLLVDPRTRL
jgi:murein DD-endopeptidase MepM/ murein hydrolase activator NlpD